MLKTNSNHLNNYYYPYKLKNINLTMVNGKNLNTFTLKRNFEN